MMLTRRCLFLLLGVLATILTLGKKATLGIFFSRPKRSEAPGRAENLFTEEGKVLVGVSGEADTEDAVREAVSLIGGWEKLSLAGKKVLVKPNVVSSKPHPSTTNPAVVKAVVKQLLEAGAAQVYVGDMSALSTLAISSTMRNMRRSGIRAAAEEAGAEVLAFEDHDWVEVDLPGARYIERALVTEWLFKVDLVVNLPVIKTHRSANYSICLKNFIGCTHLRQRPYLVDPSHWEELVAEFNLAFRPALHIADGTVSMIEGGPWAGTPSKTGLILASGDPVAADLVGLGVIGAHGRWKPVTERKPWEQRQIRRALEIGLGARREKIRLVTGSGDEEFRDLIERVREQVGL